MRGIARGRRSHSKPLFHDFGSFIKLTIANVANSLIQAAHNFEIPRAADSKAALIRGFTLVPWRVKHMHRDGCRSERLLLLLLTELRHWLLEIDAVHIADYFVSPRSIPCN